MFMLAEKQPAPDEPAQRFWIDPDVEVALNAQINEHYRPDLVRQAANDITRQAQYALMDCYCRTNEQVTVESLDDITRKLDYAEEERQTL